METMQLFPDRIAYSLLEQQELTKLSIKLPDLELNQLSNTVSTKRRRQFILGRSAAHLAISKLSLKDYANIYITIGKNGEPIWPDSLIGSIAHCSDVAVAAVAFKKDFLALGIDIEDLNKIHNPKILERIAHPSEIEWAKHSNLADCTLKIFSAKEAIYKALFPIVQHYFGFMAVELVAVSDGFKAKLKENLSDRFCIGFDLTIKQQLFKNYIISVTYIS